MSREETQQHIPGLSEEGSGLPSEHPYRHQEGGKLLQEPGDACRQEGNSRRHTLAVFPVAAGFP